MTGYVVDFGHDIRQCAGVVSMEDEPPHFFGQPRPGAGGGYVSMLGFSQILIEMPQSRWGTPTSFSLIVLC